MADPTPKPLPFEPARVRGLSEKLLRSHCENNDLGAARNLAAARAEIASLADTVPGFVRGGLLRSEAMFRGSVVLHEAYYTPISAVPLVALDLYEHSYHMDFGTAAARYVDAFFGNLDWQVIDERNRLAQAARTALAGWR